MVGHYKGLYRGLYRGALVAVRDCDPTTGGFNSRALHQFRGFR